MRTHEHKVTFTVFLHSAAAHDASLLREPHEHPLLASASAPPRPRLHQPMRERVRGDWTCHKWFFEGKRYQGCLR